MKSKTNGNAKAFLRSAASYGWNPECRHPYFSEHFTGAMFFITKFNDTFEIDRSDIQLGISASFTI